MWKTTAKIAFATKWKREFGIACSINFLNEAYFFIYRGYFEELWKLEGHIDLKHYTFCGSSKTAALVAT